MKSTEGRIEFSNVRCEDRERKRPKKNDYGMNAYFPIRERKRPRKNDYGMNACFQIRERKRYSLFPHILFRNLFKESYREINCRNN